MEINNFVSTFVFVFLTFFSAYINGQYDDYYNPSEYNQYEGATCENSYGFNGVCKLIEDCSQRDNVGRSDFCGYSRGSPIYCCPNDQDVNVGDRSGGSNLRLVEKICNRYYPGESSYFFVGGKRSLANQHPHMAAIGWTDSNGEVNWRCGGSVVTIKFIVTAAHCTTLRGIQPDIARTGDLNLLVTEKNITPQDYQIIDVYVHPEYKASEMYHDIGLLKISPDFKVSVNKRPACLWPSDEIPVKELTGMGYGTTEFSGPLSNELFEGKLTVLSKQKCSRSIRPNAGAPRGIIEGQFCAQDPNHVRDTCQGDSGGPLQFSNSTEGSIRTVIVGITSYGQYCAGKLPGVYTRVSKYLDWIESILESDSY